MEGWSLDNWRVPARIAKGVVRRRKRLAVLTLAASLAALLPVAYALGKQPPRFQTTATILLETRPDRVPVFQEFSPLRPLPVQIAILQSRSVAETVVESLSRETVLDLATHAYAFDVVNRVQRFGRLLLRLSDPPEGTLPGRAVRELQRRLTFTSTPDGIVRLVAVAATPPSALEIANTYIEVLLARTRSFNVDDARVSREFLEQQLADIKKSLKASEDTLSAFEASRGGVRPLDRGQAAAAQLTQVESALAEVETNRKMLQARLQAFRQKLDAQPAVGRTEAAARTTAPEVQRLRAQLSQLETTLLDLRMRFTEQHPRLQVVKERIAELQRELGAAVKDSTPATPAPGAVPPAERVNFSAQVVALETAFHTLTAQEDALRKQAAALRRGLRGLPDVEIEHTRLAREVESNRRLHALVSDKLAASRIREQGEMKVVKIIDPASVPEPAGASRQVAVFGLAAGLSLLLGAAVPAAVEWSELPIESEDDAVEATGLPVLATIPRTRTHNPTVALGAPDFRTRRAEDVAFTEAFHSLRVSMQFLMQSGNVRTLMVTSPLPGEGKSTVVMNLGLAWHEAAQSVVVVDSDFLRPALHARSGLPPGELQEPGFADALRAPGDVQCALTPLADSLWLVARGAATERQMRNVLATNPVRLALADLSARASVVICDSSPVLPVPESLLLASAVDGVILLAKAGSTGRRELARAKAHLELAGARILGVVINEVPHSEMRKHYYGYYATTPAERHGT